MLFRSSPVEEMKAGTNLIFFFKVQVSVVRPGGNTCESLPKTFSFAAETDLVFQRVHSPGTRLSLLKHTPLCLCPLVLLDNYLCQI